MWKKPMGDTQIIPAILATTEEEYKEKLRRIGTCPELVEGWVQIDLVDNKFAHNKTIGPEIIGEYPTPLKKEIHLMVNYPEGWIDQLVRPGVERIVIPIEDKNGTNERIKHLKNHGIEAGLSVNPETEVDQIKPFLDKIDVVLLLSVHPGFGGQEFIPSTLAKIQEMVKLKGQGHFKIEVDGGITWRNARSLVVAGVDNLVIGAHLIDGDVAENLKKIRQAIDA